MIPRADITAWRHIAPWITDAMVEQDLMISRALIEIFSHPELRKVLVFRGGTALHKLHLQPPFRYSEDIDLVQIEPGPIGPVFDTVRELLCPWLGDPRRKQGKDIVTLTFSSESEVPPIEPLRLKIEINTREHFHVNDLEERPLRVSSNWFTGQCDLRTYSLEELLGTKMRALYQRRKGRDLYDLRLGLDVGNADPAGIVKCFQAYMLHSESRVTRRMFEINMEAKMSHPNFLNDIEGLLRGVTTYNPHEAYEYLSMVLLPLMDTRQ